MVERNLAKVKVAGSSLVSRSEKLVATATNFFYTAWVVELVDTQDLKSCGFTAVRVRPPSRAQVSEVFSSGTFFLAGIGPKFGANPKRDQV